MALVGHLRYRCALTFAWIFTSVSAYIERRWSWLFCRTMHSSWIFLLFNDLLIFLLFWCVKNRSLIFKINGIRSNYRWHLRLFVVYVHIEALEPPLVLKTDALFLAFLLLKFFRIFGQTFIFKSVLFLHQKTFLLPIFFILFFLSFAMLLLFLENLVDHSGFMPSFWLAGTQWTQWYLLVVRFFIFFLFIIIDFILVFTFFSAFSDLIISISGLLNRFDFRNLWFFTLNIFYTVTHCFLRNFSLTTRFRFYFCILNLFGWFRTLFLLRNLFLRLLWIWWAAWWLNCVHIFFRFFIRILIFRYFLLRWNYACWRFRLYFFD